MLNSLQFLDLPKPRFQYTIGQSLNISHRCIMNVSVSDRWKGWSSRMEKCGYPPNLGLGGSVVAALVTSFFAAHAADTVFVIFAFGPRAFFIDGLRVADWKHGVLSTGAKIPPVRDLVRGFLTLPFWIAFIGISEVFAGMLANFLMHRPRWMSSVARILGGFLLLAFAGEFSRINGRLILFHPISIGAIIGGSVLIWRGMTSVFRRDA